MSYLENAKTALNALNRYFYNNGSYKNLYIWSYPLVIEIVEDAYEKTQDESYKNQISELINTVKNNIGIDWSTNESYSDISKMAIVFARASAILNDLSLMDTAKSNLNYIINSNAINDFGLIVNNNKSPNTVDSLAFSAALGFVGNATNDELYKTLSTSLMDSVINHLYIDETGELFDGLNDNNEGNHGLFGSNIGYFMRAAHYAYKFTNDEKYLNYAIKATGYFIDSKYRDFKICSHDNDDGSIFKTIFIRESCHFANIYKIDFLLELLSINSELVWKNRNKYDLMQNDFCHKTTDHKMWKVLDLVPAVALLINIF